MFFKASVAIGHCVVVVGARYSFDITSDFNIGACIHKESSTSETYFFSTDFRKYCMRALISGSPKARV